MLKRVVPVDRRIGLLWLVAVGLAALATTVACGGGASDDDYFIDAAGGGGGEALWAFPGDGSLSAIVANSDALIVAEVAEVVSVDYSGPRPTPDWMDAALAEVVGKGSPYTTYRLEVDAWINGSGGQEVLLTDYGGISEAGPVSLGGDFVLETGQTYAMTLESKHPDMPGTGEYTRSAGARGTFQVTDGYVRVLDDPITDGVAEQYGGMSLDEFVGELERMVAGTYEPPPVATPKS